MSNRSTPIFSKSLVALAVSSALLSSSADAALIEITHPWDSSGEVTTQVPGFPPVTIDFVCSLRESLVSVQNGVLEPGCFNPSPLEPLGVNDRIRVGAGAGIAANHTFSLSQGELYIDTNGVDIDLGGRTISGNNTSRVFNIIHATVTMSSLTISNGSSSSDGGGLRISRSIVSLNKATVSNNTAATDGGAIKLEGGGGYRVTIADSVISNNAAGKTGGGIYNDFRYAGSTTMELIRTTISENSATYYGGGVYVQAEGTIINNCTIEGNIADKKGGGIFAASGLNLYDSTVANNSAPRGGGVHFEDGPGKIDSTTISANSASGHGGGLSLRAQNNNKITVSNSTISGNSASIGGGGIVLSEGETMLTNITVSNNSAFKGAGLRLESNADVTLNNSILADSVDGPDCLIDIGSLSVNASIIEDGSCNAASLGALTVDPGMALLDSNGGPTQTQSIDETSPAFGTADPDRCPPTDQRGEKRDSGSLFFPVVTKTGAAAIINLSGSCDMGAYEVDEGGTS